MSLLILLCRSNLWNVFDGYALTGVGFDVVPVPRQFGNLNIPDEAVIHRHPLNPALANAFCLEYVDVVDQLLQKRTGQHLHIEESADRVHEGFLTELEFIGFGEFFA